MISSKRRTFSEDTLRLHVEASAKKFRALTMTRCPSGWEGGWGEVMGGCVHPAGHHGAHEDRAGFTRTIPAEATHAR